MHFHCSEELTLTRTMVSEFAANRIAPGAGRRDEDGRFDRRLFEEIGLLGLAGIPWPERYGGAGSDMLTYSVALEEISKACASTGAVLSAHVALSAWPVYMFGSEELKQAYLGAMASGTVLGACCFPVSGSGANGSGSGITVGSEDDVFILNGSSSDVVNAENADIFVVFAQEQSGRRGRRRSAFVVERGTPGLAQGRNIQALGLRSCGAGEIRFTQCRIPKRNLLGKAGQGGKIAASVLDLAHLSASAQAVGIAQGALDAAAAYAKERKQFGQLIGRHQGIMFKLADMAVQIDAARLLARQAAWRHPAGLSLRKEAALSWQFASRTAVGVTIEAVQVLGGYGYMQEYQVERHMRDAKCLEAGYGTGGGLAGLADAARWMLADSESDS
ncbi:acyl-CoA dehydrogenase family protein [Paenibacillus spongiae]|uniref:Acyl-CoA dehydrogenase family protein n=1 Tax=Paenibacillus spongiae TaxID=2909671 RepID=A0ABY5SFE6_9BACL|nr:acyl-CoA dehydrogenase family protein [Paenibacillus spongiae]UVI32656.1 acyl-CoA dehydrogenase family protein [Paenibacillus spongiae]